jgi:telomerase reverse transcriptase
MFSVGEIYGRIKAFAAGLPHPRPRLFFAKVDVRAAFDTIPQTAVLRLMGTIPDAARRQYTIAKHVEVKPSDGAAPAKSGAGPSAGSVPQGSKRWHSAAVADSFAPFPDRVDADLAPGRKNTIFVDAAVSHMHSTLSLLTLLAEHVDTNIVKIGKKYYRQRSGVPQGSVVSSMLCNYFYGDLEARHLGFLAADDGSREGSLLMRLVDDFLLITTDEARAARFVRTMHAGVPEYGVAVNPAKTLVNFDLVVEGRPVPRVHEGAGGFPYCGTLIDCRTLEISRDRARGAGVAVEDCLTVDRGRMPGQNFRRKMLSMWGVVEVIVPTLILFALR